MVVLCPCAAAARFSITKFKRREGGGGVSVVSKILADSAVGVSVVGGGG